MILPEALVTFAQIAFTIWFAIRTRRKLSTVFFHQDLRLLQLGTAFVFAATAISLCVSAHHFLFFTPTLLCFLFPISFRTIYRKRLEKLCHRGFPVLIESILLAMYRGIGFRSALRSALPQLPPPLAQHLDGLLNKNSEAPSAQSSLIGKISQKYALELLKIEHLESNQLHRLKSLRRHIHDQNNFRHKSGQALLQTHIQSLFITLFYVLVLLFNIHSHPWRDFKFHFFVSLGLLICGFTLLRFTTRKTKWKT